MKELTDLLRDEIDKEKTQLCSKELLDIINKPVKFSN